MKKVSKILVTAIFSILILFAGTTVRAEKIELKNLMDESNVGNTVDVSLKNMEDSSNLYCVQHKAHLSSTKTFKIINYVEITGKKAVDSNGTEVTSSANGIFAYILSKGEGYGTFPNYTSTQKGVYAYINTWSNKVGKDFSLSWSCAANSTYTSDYVQEGKDYVDGLIDEDDSLTHTDKTLADSIGETLYKSEDGTPYVRVGPFKWDFEGTIDSIIITDQNGDAISDVQISAFEGETEKFGISELKSGKNFYLNIKANSGVTAITKISANQKISQETINAKVWFLYHKTHQKLIAAKTSKSTSEITDEFEFTYNYQLTGALDIEKVDEDDNSIKLEGVEFIIKNDKLDLYIQKTADGKTKYVAKESATTFKTDSDGNISVDNLYPGKYTAYETANPNYGYELKTDGTSKTIVRNEDVSLMIENKQIYVKLGGYVWQDNSNQKGGTKDVIDNLYYAYNSTYSNNGEEKVSKDQLIQNITVNLKDASNKNEVIKTAQTDSNGAYEFVDVLIEKLSNYYVEFTYDGFTYTPVELNLNISNGSKAGESAENRTNLNNKFMSVTGTKDLSLTSGLANGQSSQINLNYNRTHTDTEQGGFNTASYINESWTYKDKGSYIIATRNNDIYDMIANTSIAKYDLSTLFKPGTVKINDVNLGLKQREQPNALIYNNDVESVILTINGYTNTYKYNQKAQKEQVEGGLNIAANISSYKRYIYTSDIEYNKTHSGDKNLKVFVTCKVTLKNASNTLKMDINELVDYYDSKYKDNYVLVDENGNTISNLKTTQSSITNSNTYSSSNYKATYISGTSGAIATLNPGESKDVYIKFELSESEVLNILNGERTVNNVAEIYSYTTKDSNGNVYATVDMDSAAGNAIPGDTSTYENDTQEAPTLALKPDLEKDRTLEGIAFVDTTEDGLHTAQIRQGDGTYTNGEAILPGVQVTMTENLDSTLTYTTTTGDDGTFKLENFVPGDYTIYYTWGNETYTVQDYKATVYMDKDRQNNKEWYKTTDPRYSDAFDNYQTREAIDNEIKIMQNSTTTTIDKMTSSTPTLGIGIEYVGTVQTVTNSNDFRVEDYNIKNVDFGIARRAIQSAVIAKNVSYVRLTLANGQVLVEGDPKDNLSYVTYLPATGSNNGIVQVTVDNELIHGATLEIQYQLVLTNNGELDYTDQNYYNYGTYVGYNQNKIVKMTSATVVDYVDNNLEISTDAGCNYTEVTAEDLVNNGLLNIQESLKDNIDSHTKIVTIDDFNNISIAPGESTSANINMSKLLSNDDELEFNNSTEVAKTIKTGGSTIKDKLGVFIISSKAETTTVVPPTGQTRIYYIIGFTVLAMLAAGIIVIITKVIIKKNN